MTLSLIPWWGFAAASALAGALMAGFVVMPLAVWTLALCLP